MRPARGDPKDNLAAWTSGLALRKLMKGGHGKLEAVDALILRGAADVAETDSVVIKRGAELDAVCGEALLDLGTVVAEECKCRGVRQAATIRA
jgi:hypothetical protein